MAARTSMAALVALVRTMINDPSGATQTFTDDMIQARLDAGRDDIRYEPLILAPTFANVPNTAISAQTIYADYYSKYGYWESDVVLQGYNSSTGQYWAVLSPVTSELLAEQAHWTFESDPFNQSGGATVPGQLPPLFATGKVYNPYSAAADLLEFWAATSVTAYDVTTDGQTFRRSQITQARLMLAAQYRRRAKPRVGKMTRMDVTSPVATRKLRSLDEDDQLKGGY